jgi:enoyl-CoA hydratase/carnithine racemase
VSGDRKNGTTLDVRVAEGVTYLTLNGPPKNEMDSAFFHRLADFRRRELMALDVSGVVIQGAGRHFSSGADLPEIEALAASREDRVEALLEDNIQSFLALSRFSVPIVAVIRGACLGAGMELALACHFRVAETNAVFALPEVTYGIMPGCGGTIRLPGCVGTAKAVELILSGRTVSAEEALAIGLVDRLVERGRGVDAALELIRHPPREPAT